MKNKYLVIIISIIVLSSIFFIATKNNSATETSSGTPIQSHLSYTVKSDSQGKMYAVNAPNEYTFSIVDEEGNTLKDFAITHTKPMHVIVVRKDLAYFQHIHPLYNSSSGTFTLEDLMFPADGDYRIFADFAVEGGEMDNMGMPLAITLSQDVSVGSMANYEPQELGNEERNKSFEGLQIVLNTHGLLKTRAESMLMFYLSQNGNPVIDLEQYLGALGHSVILREGSLDFIHAHPMENLSSSQTGNVDFMVDFPEPGRYKLFTQFQRNGKVITSDFVVTVAEGASSDSTVMDMHGMH
ncbi:MAG: hypothetical protein K1X61_13270 [Chitinophagales bacterium]|nr:hypothetical protein [Chitinophagales bacterium]